MRIPRVSRDNHSHKGLKNKEVAQLDAVRGARQKLSEVYF